MRRCRKSGFTLLEVLVATTIMAIAIGTLMSALTTSVRNAAKVTESDRAAILAKRTLDTILAEQSLPEGQVFQGVFDPREAFAGGWRARVEPFEALPDAPPSAGSIQRVVVQVYWPGANGARIFELEGYRRVPRRTQ